jgi:hypothetical protein
MRIKGLFVAMWCACSVVAATAASAQGVQTGTIRGVVKDAQELAVPGVTVTATSPVLQGPRTTVTDTQGLYVLRALPPGDYQLKFELNGFATVVRGTAAPLGLTIDQNVTMRAAGVAETVQVVAEAPAPIVTPVVGLNFKHEEIEALATPRTIEGIAQLSPGVSENTPNQGTTGGSVGQIIINGAFAFDNVFMINGVDINDNLFAQPQNLFIEDAIEETQVLTSGISAEFGRFSGGVVNAITKSGGNVFAGSGRVNFSNPAWTTETPFEVSRGTTHVDQTSRVYEGTFGGPLMRDRLWFFSSGRYGKGSNQVTLAQTGIGLASVDTNKRGEIKITGTVAQGHTIQSGYLNSPRTRTNNSGLQSYIIDPHSEVDRGNPNWYYYANYRGVQKNNLLVEAQYSERRYQFTGDGGTSTNILDSPFLSAQQCQCLYNGPYFDATDPEHRNNRQLTGSVTDYWSLGGRHETKGGYEWFRSQRTGGNSQSATSYVFNADFATGADGAPLLDSTGRAIPMFVPGITSVDFWPATRGGVTNIDNNSAYIQDHWTINGRWSADLGARYEHVKAVSNPGSVLSIDSNRIVPRLAASWDLKGDGNRIVHLTYGQYSGRYNEAQIVANSPVGNPPDINFTYAGPVGQGRDFAPGFNLSNYPLSSAFVFNAPLANTFMAPGLKSPLTHEFTASYGANLWNGRGYAEGAYVWRRTRDLIEDFQTLANGSSHVLVSITDAAAGSATTDPTTPAFTNRIYENTNLAHREYDALILQSRYRITNAWSVAGHYTVQLRNNGNYEGEGSSTPGSTVFSNSPSIIGNYPEVFNADRNYPDGRLQAFQRHHMRVWTVYNWNMGPFGDASVSGLWRVDSGLAYSLAARNQVLSARQVALMTAAGYPEAANLAALGPIAGNAVFFDERGSETFKGSGLLDTSINYNVPVFRTLKPWIKLDIYNLFDNRKLIAWSTTIKQDTSTPTDSLGLRTGYVPTTPATYGTATGNTVSNLFSSAINAYPLAFSQAPAGGRTFRVAVGFRF